MLMEQKAIIETDRLFLREMNMDDFSALYQVLANSDIMQHYPAFYSYCKYTNIASIKTAEAIGMHFEKEKNFTL